MTEDTAKALEIMKPLMDELNIKVTADNRLLTMNGTGIGISCNSTWATIMEMIGFLFMRVYAREFRPVVIDRDMRDDITRYWITSEMMNRLRGGSDEETDRTVDA